MTRADNNWLADPEQRPDVGISDPGQDKAEEQGQQGGNAFIADELSPAFGMLHVIHREQLL